MRRLHAPILLFALLGGYLAFSAPRSSLDNPGHGSLSRETRAGTASRTPAMTGAPTAGSGVRVEKKGRVAPDSSAVGAPSSDAVVTGSASARADVAPSSSARATANLAPAGSSVAVGTASWFASYGPGLYAAVNSYRWGQPRYRVRVTGPAGSVWATVRDHCRCVVNGKVRLIDVSPDAFRRVCGPLSKGLCSVTVKGMR